MALRHLREWGCWRSSSGSTTLTLYFPKKWQAPTYWGLQVMKRTWMLGILCAEPPVVKCQHLTLPTGRVIAATFCGVSLVNIYSPSGTAQRPKGKIFTTWNWRTYYKVLIAHSTRWRFQLCSASQRHWALSHRQSSQGDCTWHVTDGCLDAKPITILIYALYLQLRLQTLPVLGDRGPPDPKTVNRNSSCRLHRPPRFNAGHLCSQCWTAKRLTPVED
jgi:hypothetical protein